jgi:hypothetical protein
VWQNVSAKAARLGSLSPTDAQEVIYTRHARTLDEYVETLPRATGQSGVLVGVGGRVACLDFVSRPDVFAGLYAKLLRGYALEAKDEPLLSSKSDAFLGRLARSRSFMSVNAGSGASRRFAGDVVGAELAAYGETIAVSAFPAS